MKKESRGRVGNELVALAVLALLSEQPRHPYEMQRLMRERHIDFATGKTRTFYDAVDRLRRGGLVEPGETSREGRHPERTVYHITAAGREKFEAWLANWLSSPVAEFPVFTAAVCFLGYFPPARVAALLRVRAAALEGKIAGMNAVMRSLLDEVGLPRVVLLENEYTGAMWQAELAWSRSVIADLESGTLNWDRDAELLKLTSGVTAPAPTSESSMA